MFIHVKWQSDTPQSVLRCKCFDLLVYALTYAFRKRHANNAHIRIYINMRIMRLLKIYAHMRLRFSAGNGMISNRMPSSSLVINVDNIYNNNFWPLLISTSKYVIWFRKFDNVCGGWCDTGIGSHSMNLSSGGHVSSPTTISNIVTTKYFKILTRYL